MNYNKQNLAQK